MIFSARFKNNLFFVPSHWPVYTPTKFCSLKCTNIDSFAISAFTFVRKSVFAIIICDFSSVFVALVAENCHWPVNIRIFHFVLVIAVFVQTFFDFFTALEGFFHSFCVTVCTVTASLIKEFWMDSHTWKLIFNINFVVAGVIFVTAGCIRNHSDWIAKIFFENFWVWHICRNFSKNIVVVP